MPTAHGFDEMHNTTLYHLNAYTYTDPAFNPDFPFDDAETMEMWGNVIGAVEGKAGEPWQRGREARLGEDPVHRREVDRSTRPLPRRPRHRRRAVLPVPEHGQDAPAEPARTPTSSGSRWRKSKYADSLVELDHHVGVVVDKVRELGIEQDTLDHLDDGQRRVAGRLPRLRLHAVQGHEGHRLRGRQPGAGHRLVAGHDRARPAQRRHRRLARLHGHVRQPRRARPADRGPRGPADDLRQLRPDRRAHRRRAVDARPLVLHDRDRADPRRRPARQVEGDLEHPRPGGAARPSTRTSSRSCSTCGRIRASGTTSS